MKKVGIITIDDYTNYGNRLQTYATQKILKKIGFEPITLLEENKKLILKKTIELLLSLKDESWKKRKEIFKKILINRVKKKKERRVNEEKIGVFKEFNKNFLNERLIKNKESLEKINREFDYFIVGSDQIWNPYFIEKESTRFLSFAQRYKRIALSPSITTSNIPEYKKQKFKEGLRGINYLSIREEEGAQLIKKITKRKAKVLVDPTLALDKKDWNQLSKKVNNKPKKYILCYMVGSLNGKEKIYINEISKKNNLEIININSPKDWMKYKCGPSEFLDLLKSSRLICTNSFHGVIFSMIFSVPFIIFNREDYIGNKNMSSRMSSLSKKFNLDSRFSENIKEKDIFDMNFQKIEKKIKSERKKLYSYLKKALNTKK